MGDTETACIYVSLNKKKADPNVTKYCGALFYALFSCLEDVALTYGSMAILRGFHHGYKIYKLKCVLFQHLQLLVTSFRLNSAHITGDPSLLRSFIVSEGADPKCGSMAIMLVVYTSSLRIAALLHIFLF